MLVVIPAKAGIHAGPNGCLFIGKPFFGTNMDSHVRGNDEQSIDSIVEKMCACPSAFAGMTILIARHPVRSAAATTSA